MNTISIVELQRYGWSQKLVRKSCVIVGKPPYVEALKPLEVRKRVSPKRKSRSRYAAGEDLTMSKWIECDLIPEEVAVSP